MEDKFGITLQPADEVIWTVGSKRHYAIIRQIIKKDFRKNSPECVEILLPYESVHLQHRFDSILIDKVTGWPVANSILGNSFEKLPSDESRKNEILMLLRLEGVV